MIFHDVQQNTPEWDRLRLGIPTASEFHRIVTPKTMKPSAQSKAYMNRLLAEWVAGEPCENEVTQWMERGHDLEDSARKAYELLTGNAVTNGGFITSDDGMLGCSPDGLVREDGDVELKTPLIQTQIGYALTGAVTEDYHAQLQGRLMIHEREWVDIFSYHPRLVIPPIRVVRDEKYIAALRLALELFVSEMLEKREELERRFGPFVRTQDAEDPEPPNGLTDSDVEEYISHLNATDGWAQC